MRDEEPMKWDEIVGTVVEAAMEEAVGRGREASLGAPYTEEDAQKIARLRNEKEELHKKRMAAQGTSEEAELAKTLRQASRRLDHTKCEARHRWVKGLAKELGEASRREDMGRFHKGMRKVCIYMGDKSREGQDQFTHDEIIKHVEAINCETASIDEETLKRGRPRLEEDKSLKKKKDPR